MTTPAASPIPTPVWDAFALLLDSVGAQQKKNRDALLAQQVDSYLETLQSPMVATKGKRPKIRLDHETVWSGHAKAFDRFLGTLEAHYPNGMPPAHDLELSYPKGLAAQGRALPTIMSMKTEAEDEARAIDFFVRGATIPQIKRLLALGVNPSIYSSAFHTTTLGSCALRADWRRAQVLLEGGADVHVLSKAEHGTSPNFINSTLLHRVLSRWGNTKLTTPPPAADRQKMILLMVKHGADLAAARADGVTALQEAGIEDRAFLDAHLANEQLKGLEQSVSKAGRSNKGRL